MKLSRRNLTDDQRAMIAEAVIQIESKLARSQQAKEAGKQGGRGNKKSVEAEASTTLSKPAKERTRLAVSKRHKVSERKIKLARIDATNKEAWDAKVAPLKRKLRALGADSAAMSAVRLTRLPGCARPEKNGFQRLLYLNPNATTAPLLAMPILETRQAALARWREVCPRWKGARAHE